MATKITWWQAAEIVAVAIVPCGDGENSTRNMAMRDCLIDGGEALAQTGPAGAMVEQVLGL